MKLWQNVPMTQIVQQWKTAGVQASPRLVFASDRKENKPEEERIYWRKVSKNNTIEK